MTHAERMLSLTNDLDEAMFEGTTDDLEAMVRFWADRSQRNWEGWLACRTNLLEFGLAESVRITEAMEAGT